MPNVQLLSDVIGLQKLQGVSGTVYGELKRVEALFLKIKQLRRRLADAQQRLRDAEQEKEIFTSERQKLHKEHRNAAKCAKKMSIHYLKRQHLS